MIDMRSDSGEVQYDGFEYNWRFRQEGWKAQAGSMGFGGLVRRRRWLRLMMRPGRKKAPAKPDKTIVQSVPSSVASSVFDYTPRHRESVNLDSFSQPPSVTFSISETEHEGFELGVNDVWTGDDVELDWRRCHSFMKRLGRDGTKLELWKRWLETEPGRIRKGKQKQWTEDSGPLPSEAAKEARFDSGVYEKPALEHIAAVLRVHVGAILAFISSLINDKQGNALLHSFIYPDSRAEFLELLGRAKLLPELNIRLGVGWSASEVDFWSYESLDVLGKETNDGVSLVNLDGNLDQ
jgi:hypothetical protein